MEPRYKKADARKLARPYAKAAFELAARKGTTADWEKKLGLLAEALEAQDQNALLHNPRLRPDKLKEIMAPVLDKLDMDGEQKNLVNLLIDNQKLGLLRDVFNAFVDRRKQVEKVQDVTVVSAIALTEMQVDKIKDMLKQKYGITPEMKLEVDVSLIGGVRIIMGDTVIDNSIKGQLERMEAHLKGPQNPKF
ncbi:MAG: F0F1 ATP synthase subunit delta [Alphaproteobacteria bacterium]|nr:F0F1 ATP synthase subunit delta [Alphaproteobacteria bacterium]